MYLCGNLTKLQSIISEYSKGIEILSILALADHLKSCHVSSPPHCQIIFCFNVVWYGFDYVLKFGQLRG